MAELRQLFPYTFNQPPTWFFGSHWLIVVDWLEREIEDGAEERLPILRQIVGHRNHEVHDYVTTYMDTVGNERICREMYGAYKIENVKFRSYRMPRKPTLVWSRD